MVKAVIGRSVDRTIAASTAEESMPPDRKAPTGTSDSMCRAVASSSIPPHFLGPLFDGTSLGRAELRLPIGRNAWRPLGTEGQIMARIERRHLAVDGARPAHMAEREEVVDRPVVTREFVIREKQQSLELRPNDRPPDCSEISAA